MTNELIRRANIFRSLHQRSSPLVLLNVWDGVSAAIFSRAGAPALGTTSAGVAWSAGYADGEHMPFPDLVRVVANICRVATVPVSVDIEHGFGARPAEVAANVGALLDAGAIGVNIEDGIDETTGGLRSPQDLADRIAAIRALANSRGVPLFINARTDAYFLPAGDAEQRFEDAAARLELYTHAGSDGAFAPGPDRHRRDFQARGAHPSAAQRLRRLCRRGADRRSSSGRGATHQRRLWTTPMPPRPSGGDSQRTAHRSALRQHAPGRAVRVERK